tara:strand:+ start:238 stop:867 length:630 start_codon:yes stop_codon:yes gene_type:complete
MKRYFFFFSITLLAFAINAQDLTPAKNAKAVKDAFTKMNASTKSFSSDFKQTKEFSFMDRPLVSTGKFYYQKSDQLRWEYISPLQYVMLINGDNIRIKEDGKVKTYSSAVNEVFKTVKEIILGCISGEILNDPNYEPAFYESDKLYQVKLQPKDKQLKEYMKEINIFLDKSSNELSYLILKDGSGDITKIEFHNRKINQSIDASTFSKF